MTAEARPGLRYELKLSCEESAYSKLRSALWLDRACLRRLYPTRVVQSVYLDTPRGAAVAENLAGISDREKWRVRWYGEAATDVRAHLERKVRRNTLGWKENIHLARPLDVEGLRRNAFLGALLARLPQSAATRLDGLVPAQWIRYEREYLTSADRKLRVTVDRGITSWDLRLAPVLARRTPTPLPRILVLEVKCAPGDLDRARALVARLPLIVGRSSKFAMASEAGGGPLNSILGD